MDILDVGPMLPAMGSAADWLSGLAPFIAWMAPVLLVVAGIAIMPLVGAGLGSMFGPDLEKRAQGRFSTGYDSGFLGAAERHGEVEGWNDYVGALSDPSDSEDEDE